MVRAGNNDRAQELTQAALVKTYLAWPRIDSDRAVDAIAIRVATMRQRSNSSR